MIPKGPWVAWNPWTEEFYDFPTKEEALLYAKSERKYDMQNTGDPAPFYVMKLSETLEGPVKE